MLSRRDVFNVAMGALRFRLVQWLRARGRTSAAVMATVAVVAVIPLTLAVGARRTASAPDRYVAAQVDAPDLTLFQDGGGPPRTGAIAALPSVLAVDAMTFVFGGVTLPNGEILPNLVFTGTIAPTGDRLVAGREPDPTRPGEFVATRGSMQAVGVGIGDTVLLQTISQETVDRLGFDVAVPDGPTIEAVLVGEIDGIADLNDPSPVAVFSPALLDDERIGLAATVLAVRLTEGATTADLRAQLDAVPGGAGLRMDPAPLIGPEIRDAVNTQALGLWILAGISGLAVVVTLGQLVLRHVRLAAEEEQSLAALGYTRAQVAGEAGARAGIIALAGAALATLVAGALSGLFPFGFARRMDPSPGLRLDGLVLATGALALALALVGWVLAVTALQQPAPVEHHAQLVDTLAGRCPTAPMATGLRFAFTSRSSVALGTRLGGLVVMVALLVGTITFGVSLQRLVDEPARYGANFDFLVDSGAAEVPAAVLAALEADDAVEAVTLYLSTQARIDGSEATVPVTGLQRRRGRLEPAVLSGRLPSGPDEIALGRVSARSASLSLGNTVDLSTETGQAEFVLTGLIVPVGIGGNDLVGQGAVITPDGFARLDPDARPSAAAVSVAGDAGPADRERLAALVGADLVEDASPTPPVAIRNVGRITYVPFVLAAVLAALGVLILVTAAYTGVRRRDRSVAVLRSLGADRRWVQRAARWQAVLAAIVPLVLGALVGIVVGRTVFRAYADGIGTVNDAAAPVTYLLVGLAALLLLAASAASIAGLGSQRLRPAELLRAE